MPKQMDDHGSTGLAGRRGQAARNDAAILDAAREVFLADPKAPVAAVAERAGVGMSALYRRYPGKEDLLRRLCHDGLRRWIEEAEAVEAEPDAWKALVVFLERIVDADVHSLTVHLAGTFTPTEEMGSDARRAAGLMDRLVERAHAAGRLRRDVVADDMGLVLESCAAIRVPDPERTQELRRRCLAMLLAGLAGDGAGPLPGPAPAPGELNWRWRRRSG
ncbi:TetR/AcrR family transcriptional regulator [Microbispora siamensis]|uniref:TetR family transcriptional regulator n=1 Tax=Microbispora siamensis TaxID=564413 RepID=A0ABQ4H176_9ACTN|nr:TetR/AcrR family transcriptional regulator [Microbispora siamensis]GIH67375.1 TetR family transcriptional regulator [Microbispora siamensis]